jgi:hypothetical protein
LLAYARCGRDERGSLMLFDADSGTRTDVALDVDLGQARGFHATWDPLGEYLLFLRDGRVVRVDSDGSNPRTLGAVYRSTSNLSFGPAGDFAVLRLPRGEIVRLLAVEGSRTVDVEAFEREFTPGQEPFVWSPDGQRIAYLAGSGWHTARADGSEVLPIEHEGEPVRINTLGWATEDRVLAESAPHHTADGVLASDHEPGDSIALPGAGLSGRGERHRAFCTERMEGIEVVSMEPGETMVVSGPDVHELNLHYFEGGERRTRTLLSGSFGGASGVPHCHIP